MISKDMQSTNSIISVPANKSADSSSDLSQFSVQELKDYFVKATLKDRKLEIARLKADLAGDKEKVKQGLSEEYTNTQWIMALRGALASKRVDRADLNSTALKLIQSKEFKLIESELIGLQRQVLARQQKRKA